MTSSPLGLCGRVLDPKTEVLCPNYAVSEVLVSTRFGLLVARLCDPCLTEHRRFYRRHARRIETQRRRHGTDTAPTGG